MRAPVVALFSLLLIASACSGATTRNKKHPAPEPSGGGGAPASTGQGGEPATTAGQPGSSRGGEPSAGGAPAEVCECMGVTITWWVDRDAVANPSVGHLRPCAEFLFDENRGEDMARRICARDLIDCRTPFNPTNLNAALAHPDMQAALAAAPVFYGVDKRPKGGQIDHMEIDGKIIELGDEFECAPDDDTCLIPDGVEAFDQLIGRITSVQLDDCGNSL